MKILNRILQIIFFGIIVRFLLLIIMGLNIRHRERLPSKGPAIIVANHNSHLDTVVLMSLFPLRELTRIHPVAAADYFLKNKWLTWFAMKIIGIIPIERNSANKKLDPLADCHEALRENKILILFPEGTRGEPEQMSTFKKGISHLAEKNPTVPVIPIFMHGLGKSLPKGEYVFVPFFCDIFVGDSLLWNGNRETYMQNLQNSFQTLSNEGHFEAWE